MNYLAHAYLSFHHPEILAGNMTSDFIKGNAKFDYSPGIQKGIQLHRAIDHFTDNHVVTKRIKAYFKPSYRLYSGALVDIVYDHFLATDKSIFANSNQLHLFSRQVYATLQNQVQQLPDKFQKLLPFMIQQDWLCHYQDVDGIAKSFKGLAYRALYLTESDTAFALFQQYYHEMQKGYVDFFPEVQKFAFQQFHELLQN